MAILQPLLQEYLIENGNLPLPATGRLSIQSTPASLTGTGKTLIAPLNKISFSDAIPAEDEVQQLAAFIARKLNISDDASKQLLENEIGVNANMESKNEAVDWPEWELLKDKKDDENQHRINLNDYLPALGVEKIHRQPVTVEEPIAPPAEIVTESVYPEYEEYHEPVAKDYWWVWALIILVVSFLLIVYRYG